ncbi:MAG: hypothetical protein IPF82_11655 [Blastocatellia bacterium]|nr:hypothetical protein [Blastocatellia bacterium]
MSIKPAASRYYFRRVGTPEASYQPPSERQQLRQRRSTGTYAGRDVVGITS